MEHIWKEATGELEDEISVSLQSIKLEQVFYVFYFQIRQWLQLSLSKNNQLVQQKIKSKKKPQKCLLYNLI
jgi:hypothetical protein